MNKHNETVADTLKIIALIFVLTGLVTILITKNRIMLIFCIVGLIMNLLANSLYEEKENIMIDLEPIINCKDNRECKNFKEKDE